MAIGVLVGDISLFQWMLSALFYVPGRTMYSVLVNGSNSDVLMETQVHAKLFESNRDCLLGSYACTHLQNKLTTKHTIYNT